MSIDECELGTSNQSTAVVTDNARNMGVAVREAGMGPHIRCLAYTLKLTAQAGGGFPCISTLLGHMRRVAAFFHKHSTATETLASKQYTG